MTGFNLTRTLPGGTVKAWPGAFATRRKAAQAVACCLADNGLATRREAAAFASDFQDHAALDSPVPHASGYAFTLTEGARQ